MRGPYATALRLTAILLACDSLANTGPAPSLPSGCNPPTFDADSFPVPIMDGCGLYGGRSNEPPGFHSDAGFLAASQVPDSGAVVISLGMSITNSWFGRWRVLASIVDRNTDAYFVQGACAGCVVDAWDTPNGNGWTWALGKLEEAGKTPADVDVVVMSVTKSQTEGATADDLDRILSVVNAQYPNVKQIFLYNRTYGGFRNDDGVDAPAEPGAWSDGLAVREFVNRHLGETSPWIGWGADLWSNGSEPRSDGFFLDRSDFTADGLHYSTKGRKKIAELALAEFEASRFATWYSSSREGVSARGSAIVTPPASNSK